MKEATSELNSTLIVVIAIAALAAFFFSVLWPMIKKSLQDDANCSEAICSVGVDTSGDNKNMVRCYYKTTNNKKKEVKEEIYCPYRG